MLYVILAIIGLTIGIIMYACCAGSARGEELEKMYWEKNKLKLEKDGYEEKRTHKDGV